MRFIRALSRVPRITSRAGPPWPSHVGWFSPPPVWLPRAGPKFNHEPRSQPAFRCGRLCSHGAMAVALALAQVEISGNGRNTNMTETIAIVTGGLRGLGRAMALGLLGEGHRVAAVGHLAEDVGEMLA